MADRNCFSKKLKRKIRGLISIPSASQLLVNSWGQECYWQSIDQSLICHLRDRHLFGQKWQKKDDPHIWRNILGVISSLLSSMAASTHCLFLLLFSQNACTCLPDIASPSRTKCSMQSPIQKANKHQLRTKKETKTKSLIRMDVSELMGTLWHKKCHLLSSTSAARTAVLPQTWTFLAGSYVSLERMLIVCLVRARRKEGEAVKELPAASPASGSSGNLFSWPSLQGLWDYGPSMDGDVSFLWDGL